jgi:hypothetical protein
MSENQKYSWFHFPNIGYISADLTEDQVKPIKIEIEKIKSNFNVCDKFNTNLVGHLDKEYLLTDSHNYIYNLIIPLVRAYEEQFGWMKSNNLVDKDLPLILDKTWVNFQKKYEFNPTHSHSGVFSFALWLDIPFDNESEYKVFPHMNIKDNRTAAFTFHYTNTLGKISEYVLPADKTWKNKIVLFPAQMVHSVNPFYTSDDYRVSVSGNFRLSA